jgi:hypothetical protein
MWGMWTYNSPVAAIQVSVVVKTEIAQAWQSTGSAATLLGYREFYGEISTGAQYGTMRVVTPHQSICVCNLR